MSKQYVRVRNRPRPSEHPGTGGFVYFHWRYGKRFWRGCRVRTRYGEGVVTSADTHINVRLDVRYNPRLPFHPNDLEIIEGQP